MPQDKPKAMSAEYNSKGQYLGSKAVNRAEKVTDIKFDSEQDKQDRNELANANEWDKPSIMKKQAARKDAKEESDFFKGSGNVPKSVSAALSKVSKRSKE